MSRYKAKIETVIRHASLATDRSALTLVEMLIAMAITLLMMAAVVTLFANIGAGVRIRRATIEMSAELRDVRTMLYNDLTHATCRATTWQRPDEDQGYIEIVEGSWSDSNPSALVDGNTTNGEIDYALSQIPGSQNAPSGQTTDGSGLGDYDDIIALTIRQENAPFRGTISANGNTIAVDASVAEVIWFAVENPADGSKGEPGMRNVYRRQLLVAPWVDFTAVNSDPNFAPNVSNAAAIRDSYRRYYLKSDVSAHIEQTSAGTFRWVPNTLGDLTKRENRFSHYHEFNINTANGFPHQFPYNTADPINAIPAGFSNSSLQPLTGNRIGEDFVLGNVLAFDVLVFDPGAPLFEIPGQAVIIEPSSAPVFKTVSNGGVVDPANLVGFGAYVDLGWDDSYDYVPTNFIGSGTNQIGPPPDFQEEHELGWHPIYGYYSTLNIRDVRGTPAVYDTWSFHYENDGLNQDYQVETTLGTQILTDEGTNGLDDDTINGVDDVGRVFFDNGGNPVYFPGERETSPPYDVPLRAVKVKLRIYEPDTRQAREVSVTASFVPQ